MCLGVNDTFFCAYLSSLPIQYISQFRFKRCKLLISRCIIQHLSIFPNQPNAHFRRRDIIFEDIALDSTWERVLLFSVDRLQLF